MLTEIITTSIVLFAAYCFVSSSSLISEKTGTANISIEGHAILGASFYVLFMSYLGINNSSTAMIAPLISMIMAGVCTMLLSTLFAVITTKLYSDQIVAGTAINLFAPAFSSFMLFILYKDVSKASGWQVEKPDIFETGDLIWLYPIIFLIFAIILISTLSIILNKTRLGLRMKASGENPYALETSGISVNKLKFRTLIISGLLAGIGGAMWAFVINQGFFYSTVLGMGYVSIGIVIFAQWSVIGIVMGSILMAILMSIFNVAITEFGEWLKLTMSILPYVVPIVILVFVKSNTMPSALGTPFKKDQR